MFGENIKNIVATFDNYYGSGKYFLLLLVALIYIFIREEDSDKKSFLVWYPCLALIIILNPIFNKIVNLFLNENVYNRLYWSIPLGIILAYAGVLLIKNISEKSKKIIMSIFICILIIFSGNFVYNKQNFQVTENLYKIPTDYLEVINVLRTIPLDERTAMVSTDLVPYVRLIVPSIRMAYPRRPDGYKDYPIVGFYESGDVKTLTMLCKEKDVNIIVYDRNILLSISPTYFGYEYYNSTERYDIYIMK